MKVRFRYFVLAIFSLCLTSLCLRGTAAAQSSPPDSPQDSAPVERVPTDKSAPPPKDNRKNPPRSDGVPAGESSSTRTRIDVEPPSDDAKSHPAAALGGGDVDEFTPYNPMRAMKAVEVGDWYFKQQNYKAALSRYQEALEYKPHDAEATFKLAEVLNQTGAAAAAAENYQAYLKILPNGPYARKAKESLEKLKKKESAQK